MAAKEAVVFLLDSSPSMNREYPAAQHSDATTRMACAKHALEGMLSDLMIRSKANEAGVVVLKTKGTKHSIQGLENDGDDDDDSGGSSYGHITELSRGGVTRPSLELLRAVRNVEPSLDEMEANTVGGDVAAGIVVAANALYQRTHGKRYRRSLVIFTDAEHQVKVDANEMLHVIQGLRDMECVITVIGLGFDESAEFDEPAKESLDNRKRARTEQTSPEEDLDEKSHVGGEDESVSGSKHEEKEDEVDDRFTLITQKREVEKFLIRLARLTGGSVIAASTMRQAMESTLGKRIPKSTRKKVELRVAPNLAVEARFSLLLSKSTQVRLKREAVMVDDNKEPVIDSLGQEMTSEITTITNHWDPSDSIVPLGPESITQGYRYGADCIPIGSIDKFGLKNHSNCCIEILGYADAQKMPVSIMVGPPYMVSGADSPRACAVVSSIAHALHRLNQVALCSFVKAKDSDKLLGALHPLVEDDKTEPSRLFFIQLPFADDVNRIVLPSLHDEHAVHEKHITACCDVIDSLQLSEEHLSGETIGNPFIRSFHKALVGRAIDPSFSPLAANRTVDDDPMSTPAQLLSRSKQPLAAFRKALPLSQKVQESAGKQKKKKAAVWGGS